MDQNDIQVKEADGLLLAPEGFIEEKYAPLLDRQGIRILQIRYLSDGPVITAIPLESMDA